MDRRIFCLILAISLLGSVNSNVTAQTRETQQRKGFLIQVNEKKKQVDITVDGKQFTSYIFPDVLKKPVLYPIRTAKGSLVTRGWPLDPRPGERTDHPHHVGLWFNFGDVNGHDFWNNSNSISSGHKGPFGTIRHNKIHKIINGKDKAELHVSMNWQNSDSVTIIKENTKFIFSGDANTRIIDRITSLTALEDIFFKDNKEGLLALRISRELEQPSTQADIFIDNQGKPAGSHRVNNEGVTGRYFSSEGKEGDDVWGSRAKWVALKGRIKDEQVSLVILDHPKNLGYPASWHARGYGLFGINPFGHKAMGNATEGFDYNLPKGKSITFTYRVIIQSGPSPDHGTIEKEFLKFAKQ